MLFSKLGLLHLDKDKVFNGFTLIPVFRGRTVNLIDVEANIVHQWNLPGRLGSLAYLLPGGNLLCSLVTEDGPPVRQAKGGHILELDWNGNIVWEYIDHSQHHDFRRLSNGNTMYLGWKEMTSRDAARVQGGIAGMEKDGKIYQDYIREISPAGETIWEWNTSELKIENYPLSDGVTRHEFAHANTCVELPNNQILLNFRNLDLMAILDKEKRHFIWEKRDMMWGRPHDPHLLENGDILFFANGTQDIIAPLRSNIIQFNKKTGSETWRYQAPIAWTFYTSHMGGVERLPNGNTLITESVNGRVFEVTHEAELAWDYINPDFDSPFPSTKALGNAIFRAFRYSADDPELAGNL